MKSGITILLALTGVPLFAVMALSAILANLSGEDHAQVLGFHPDASSLQIVWIDFFEISQSPLLTALPLFAFAGYLLARSGAPRRLLRFSRALLGWMPGGLAVVVVAVCAMITALTGASGITIIAVGGLMLPALVADHYPERFSLGLVTVSGSAGLLLPPSLPVILYGVVTGTSIEELFVAGLVPTLLVVLVLCGYSSLRAYRSGVARARFSWHELGASLREGIWEIPLPLLVPAGVLGGLFTVSEAAVVIAAYLLVVELAVYRDIRLKQVGAIARESMLLVGGILLILGMAKAVTSTIIDAEVPQQLLAHMQQFIESKLAFLVFLNLFLLLVGCMIDIYAATALVMPLVLPLAVRYDVDPVHLGVIFLTNMAIGYATPPVGLNLFIASVRFEQPVLKLYWASLPFILLLLVALALVTYFPALSLFPVDIYRAWTSG